MTGSFRDLHAPGRLLILPHPWDAGNARLVAACRAPGVAAPRPRPPRAPHAPARLLILPNAWDAGSARLVAACGAEAVATPSAGLSWSRGSPDGNALPFAILQQAIREIARAITIPLTVDIEAGYSHDP